MTSAAEQFASNINFASFAKAEELKKRLLFTLGALIVYRLGTFVPIPGIDPETFARGFQSQQGGLLGTLNIFAGGAVERYRAEATAADRSSRLAAVEIEKARVSTGEAEVARSGAAVRQGRQATSVAADEAARKRAEERAARQKAADDKLQHDQAHARQVLSTTNQLDRFLRGLGQPKR